MEAMLLQENISDFRRFTGTAPGEIIASVIGAVIAAVVWKFLFEDAGLSA